MISGKSHLEKFNKLVPSVLAGGSMYLICSTRYDYTVPVDTTTWVALTLVGPDDVSLSPNSLPYDVNRIQVDDTSGSVIEIGIGATGSQKKVALIPPNPAKEIPILLCKGQSLWVRAVDATANQGTLNIGFYKGKNG